MPRLKDPGSQILEIEGRLPSLAGWISESNTFTDLHYVCMKNLGSGERRIGLIKAPDHAIVDGGLIIDPPKDLDFPFHDPTAAWLWALRHKDYPGLQIVRFDAKLRLGTKKKGQWAPFFIVTVAEFPDYVCIVPLRSYVNLFAVHRRANRNDHSRARLQFRTDTQADLVFDDLLAPYAVHKDHIYSALLQIADASIHRQTYQNMSNNLRLQGWVMPPCDTTTNALVQLQMKEQRDSTNAIRAFVEFLEKHPEMELRFSLNFINPLICDFVLLDLRNDTYYLFEHKLHSEDARDLNLFIVPHGCDDEKYNWHFLLYQSGQVLVLHTRGNKDDANRDDTPPVSFRMDKPEGSLQFANTIRGYGPLAKERLADKWKHMHLYDANVDDNSPPTPPKSNAEETQDGSRGHGLLRSQIQQMATNFRDKFNTQCWKLGLHGCILMSNHPTADAVIIEHEWSDEEKELYGACGLLPVSLVGPHTATNSCFMLRFIPHYLRERCNSTTQACELSLQAGYDIPLCAATPFIYVATTGGVVAADQTVSLEKVAIIPSSNTLMFQDDETCDICEGGTGPRNWSYVRQTLLMHDLEKITKTKDIFSLTQAPFLRDSAAPLSTVYSFDNGDVHEYFSNIFGSSSSLHPCVTSIQDLLQAQWNHGDSRQRLEHTPVSKLMQRVLTTLPPNQELTTDTAFEEELAKRTATVVKNKGVQSRTAKEYALGDLINKTNYGISLASLIKTSGVNLATDVHCDHCDNGEECMVLQPKYSASKGYTFRCGNCAPVRDRQCTFARLSKEDESKLRSSPYFRTLVPCNNCWREGKVCDRRPGTCEECEDLEETCVREACGWSCEPRDDTPCAVSCDKAHTGDGYTNTTVVSRSEDS